MTVSRPRLPGFIGQAKRSFWLLFGGIWLFVGLIMLVTAAGIAVQERSWASEAVTTTGIVLAKDIVPADSDSSTGYRVRFRFATADGSSVEGSDAVQVATWEALTERGPIEVHYLPSSPSSARLESGPGAVGLAIFLVMGSFFGGVGGVLFGRALLGLLRARRLLVTGVTTEATVTSVEETNVSFNRQPQFRIRYTYRDGQGEEHAGGSGYLDWQEASLWKPGDPVAIRFDRRRPAESQWAGETSGPTPVDESPRIVDAPPPPS
jgi:hypothetical protein